jgi:hypothetical protein
MELTEQQRMDLVNAGWTPPESGERPIDVRLIAEITDYLTCASISNQRESPLYRVLCHPQPYKPA